MKGEGKYKELEDLFRDKLESAELIPGDDLSGRLMKQLSRREFLRFNPTRLNIFYVAGAVAAAVTAVVLLSPGKGGDIDQQVNSEKNIVKDTASLSISASPSVKDPLVVTETGKNIVSVNDAHKSKTGTLQPVNEKSVNISVKQPGLNEETIVKKTDIKEGSTQGDLTNFNLKSKIVANFELSAVSGCAPLKVRFINRSSGYDSCRWTFGDGGYSYTTNPEWIFDVEGEYKVVLQVYRKDGAFSEFSGTINIYPKPLARFETRPENPIIPDDAITFHNYSVDAIKSYWEFGDGKTSDSWEPEHKYDHFDAFNPRLIVWSEHGCTDTLTVINAFAGSGSYIKFPNAFIPNADGPGGGYYSSKSDEAAQIFHPVTSGVSDYQLRIFSKLGILIFESTDINIGWDGYNKGQLCDPGVYVWKVRGTFKNGEPFVKMGDVTLLRQQ